MTGAPVDPRTALRVEALRAACTLPIARTLGSLVGRPCGVPWDLAMEPGGRHAAVLVIGAVERWDLDALECVGRWPLPRDLFPDSAVCVGEAPAGLRFIVDCELWHGLAPAGPLPVTTTDGGMTLHFTDPPTSSVITMVDGDDPVLVRVTDGAPVCHVPEGLRRWCDPDVRWAVVERSRTEFEVLEVVAGSRTPRRAATLTVHPALAGEACVAVDAHGRRVALVFATTAVIGAWDRWSAARSVPVPALPWTDCEFCQEGRTLVLCAPGCVLRLDTRSSRTRETRFVSAARKQFALDTASGRVLHLDSAGLRVFDGAAMRTRIADHGPIVTAAASSAELLATSAADGSICVRDRATGDLRVQLQCPTHEPHVVAVTADQVIAVGAVDGLLRWSLRSGQPQPRLALRKTSEHALPRLLVTPDGRHLALARTDAARDGIDVDVVDLATGRVRRLDRIELHHRRSGALCLGFEADATRLRGATVFGYGDRIEFWTRPLAGGRREPAGESKFLARELLAISSDGRLLWWQGLAEFELWVTQAAPDVAATPLASWDLGRRISACCAGRSLFACAVDGEVWVMAADGRSLCTGLSGFSEPLAFSDDDRALWVRDESGLLLELAIPETLPDDDD